MPSHLSTGRHTLHLFVCLFVFSGHFISVKSLPPPPVFLPNYSCFELGMLEQWQMYGARQIVCSLEFANMQMPVWFGKMMCFQCCGQADVCREHVWHLPAAGLLEMISSESYFVCVLLGVHDLASASSRSDLLQVWIHFSLQYWPTVCPCGS